MPVNDVTTNRSYQKPNIANTLSDDVGRLRSALDAIDTDMASKAPSAGPTFTGVTTVAAGSAAAPSLTFTGATSDTGLYAPGADQLALSTAGTGRLFVDASGNVGIGTSAPGYVLDVGGANAGTPTINCFGPAADNNWAGGIRLASNNGTTVTAQIRASTGGLLFDYGGSERLRIDSSGRLLVGTSASINIKRVDQNATTTAGFTQCGTQQSTDSRQFTQALISYYSGNAATIGANYVFARSLNDTIGNHGIVTSGTLLGRTSFQGSDGVAFQTAASITSFVDAAPAYAATALVAGQIYRIVTVGTTNFTLIGSADNNVGTVFTATGPGTGTGTAILNAGNMPGRLVFSTTADGAATPTERMRITSTGNVGIGTSAPQTALHVETTDSPRLTLREQKNWSSGASGAVFAGINFSSSDGSATLSETRASINALFQDTFGATAGIVFSTLRVNTDASPTEVLRLAADGFISLNGDTNTGFSNPSADNLAITTAGTERARIDSSGRLLVGTSTSRVWSSTQGKLQIEDVNEAAASITCNRNDAFGPFIALIKTRGTSSGSFNLVNNGDQLGITYYNGTDGTQSVVAASIGAFVDGTPGANDMPGRLVFSTTADGAATPTERMRIGNSGRVMIGATAGSASRLEIAGPETIATFINTSVSDATYRGTLLFTDGGGGPVGGISVNTTSTQYSTTSDYRLKENVVAVTDGITRLQQLKPSRFNFIAEPNRTVDGFIAHEVQAVIPEAVNGVKDELDKDGKPKYQGIDQSKLVPLLTAALQEAVAKIESLEARLTAAGF